MPTLSSGSGSPAPVRITRSSVSLGDSDPILNCASAARRCSPHHIEFVPQFFDASEWPSPSNEEVSDLGEGKRIPRSPRLPPRSHGVLCAQSVYQQSRGITHLQPMSHDAARPGLARRPKCGDVNLSRRARGSRRTDQPKRRAVREELMIGHPRSERPAAVEKRILARFLTALADHAPERMLEFARRKTPASDTPLQRVMKRQRVCELWNRHAASGHPSLWREHRAQPLAYPSYPGPALLDHTCGGSKCFWMSHLFTSNRVLR